MTEEFKIGIAGLGNVGSGVFRLLAQHGALVSERAGRKLKITAVSARDKNKMRGVELGSAKWYDTPADMAEHVDVVVELMGGASGAAFDLIKRAIELDKPVVTANKALLATRAAELLALLGNSKSTVSFEAAVAGGIPVIKGLKEGLAANKINAVYGILNGTCNFVLSEMRASERDFATVLKEAQKKGYAEADPSFDIDGMDAAHKLAILAGLAFGMLPDPAGIAVKGIRSIAPLDIAFADELGYRIKLLGIARRTKNGIEQSVEPCLVPKASPVAAVEGALNAVYIDADYAGKTLLVGAGAGGDATASAVVADIIDVARGRALPLMGRGIVNVMKSANIKDRKGSYYFRLMVLDQPGVVADISAILRDGAISIESVLQRGRDPGMPVPLILTTHDTTEGDMQKALDLMSKLKSVTEPPYVMRIESFKMTAVLKPFAQPETMERNLAIELIRVTEAAALSASLLMGRGDEKAADQAAVDAMRTALNALHIDGTVVIGEGERDEAPMLYIGEKVGSGDGPQLDIALDPLEGTTITAKGGPNALAVVAMAEKGGFLNAPDVYMEKIAISLGAGIVDLDETPGKNLKELARAKKLDVSDLVACILDRPRHQELIAKVRESGARIMLIPDGDVSGVIAATEPSSGIDIYLGSGGAPEGVLAAAALRCTGGFMQGKLLFRNDDERARAKKWGVTNLTRKYELHDLAKGDVMFAATGVTDGAMLKGVRRFAGGATTHSIIMRSKTGTIRRIEATHNFTRKSGYK